MKDFIKIADSHLAKTYNRFPIMLVKGKGTKVWDSEGKEYIDFLAGVAVNIIGHAHPKVAKAIAELLNVLSNNRYSKLNEAYTRIHNEIYNSLPGEGKIISDDGVIPFEKLDSNFARQVGSKCANLGELKNCVGLLVPDGFAISAYGYQLTMEKNNVQEKKAADNYGLPETKEFPLHTPSHVYQALEVFPIAHRKYEIPERIKIAQKIMRKAAGFRMPVKTEIIIKYASLPDETCRSDQAAANIAARSLFVQDLNGQALFNKLAHGLMGNINGNGTLIKMAGILEQLDDLFGVSSKYARGHIFDPISTIFNMSEKQAMEVLAARPITIGGEMYDVNDLMNIPIDLWVEALGEDFGAAIADEDGSVDGNKLADILPTLPLPEQNILDRYLKQYYATHEQPPTNPLVID